MLGPLILAVALATANGPSIDPAVSACIALSKEGLRTPQSFSLAGQPRFDRASVTIDFDTLDAHRKVSRQSATCAFAKRSDGLFHMVMMRRALLEQRMKDANVRLKAATTSDAMNAARSSMMDIGREMAVQGDRLKRAEAALRLLGDYPIAPAQTGLRD